MTLQSNFSLKDNNTFRIDAKAKFYTEVKSVDEIMEGIHLPDVQGLPVFVLGDGANILLVNGVVNAFVIKMSIKGVNIISEDADTVLLEVGAGEEWNDLVNFAVDKGYGGIENMALIPGTVGAAVAQNIAAYGQNLVDVFESLDAIDLSENKMVKFEKRECEFSYRESIFKHKFAGKFIVTKVRVRLSKNSKINTSYFETGTTYTSHASIVSELESFSKPPYSLKDVRDAVIRIRTKKLPDPNLIGTAGSFFKNPVVKKEIYEKLKANDPDLQCYPIDGLRYATENDKNLEESEYVKISAGRLLDFAGWKGKRVGDVGTYKNQALAIVSYGATGKEILEFANMLQEDIYKKFGIKLEREVQLINF